MASICAARELDAEDLPQVLLVAHERCADRHARSVRIVAPSSLAGHTRANSQYWQRLQRSRRGELLRVDRVHRPAQLLDGKERLVVSWGVLRLDLGVAGDARGVVAQLDELGPCGRSTRREIGGGAALDRELVEAELRVLRRCPVRSDRVLGGLEVDDMDTVVIELDAVHRAVA